MKKLRILMVITAFAPYIGGAEKQVEKLASELMKKNIDVTVVTGRWSNSLKKYEEINGLKVIRNLTNFKFWGKDRINIETGFFYTDQTNKNEKFKSLKIFLRKLFVRSSIYIYQVSLFVFLLSNKKIYDIIHVHQVLYPAFISTLCSRILSKPVIAKIGNSGFNSDINQIKKFPEGRLQLKYILKNINKVICTTTKMKEELLNEGINKDKMILIHNGVKIKEFYRSYESNNNLVYAGRFIKNKNINTLVFALLRVIQITGKKVKLNLIGDGPEKENIVNLIKELHLEENVVLTGMVDNPEDFLKKSDIFVLPSLVEGLSNSLIEAISYKLPCIVSNIPGNTEVIGDIDSGYNIENGQFMVTGYGVLFNPSDVEGLANSIKHLLDNKKIRETISENAYSKIKNEFDIEVIAEKYSRLYEEILN
jgi:glycosyltransferase involved in cell wall biosynthesis